MNADPLVTTLIDLARSVTQPDFRLILGGGFGLYLKQLHLQRQSAIRTLVPGELWPYPRATEDLDVFIPTEFLVNLDSMRILRAALDRLGFVPVERAKFLHLVKQWPNGWRVKIDMLTGPLPDEAGRTKLKLSAPRVRPRGSLELHAYLTKEALDIESSLLPLPIDGAGSDGIAGQLTVFVPQAFTFLRMKLHAFADRVNDDQADLGRHHALDVYRLIAMLTEEEQIAVRRGIAKHAASKPIQRAREIAALYFSSSSAMGIIRLKEHPLFNARMQAEAVINELAYLFQ
ncbi:MAG: hypothetical protein ABSH22_05745 [Tepidisphaeraceae bacterium]